MKRKKRNHSWKFFFFGLFVFLLLFAPFCRYGSYEPGKGQVVLIHGDSKFLISVEVADTPTSRAQGLMYRESLAPESGMFFVFPEEGIRNFWMKNTLMPLDILFLSSSQEIVGIAQNAEPCRDGEVCPHISSEQNAQYVLELSGGFVEENGISLGDRVEFDYPFDHSWLKCGPFYFP